MVTIKDIARESGFSVATVSRILSGTDYAINAETRRKVEECAASMGYLPNLVARSLRTKKSSEIAVIIPSFRNPFYTDALNGIEKELTPSGYDMVVYLNRNKQADSKLIMNSVLRKKMSGIIIATDCVSFGIERQLLDYQKEAPVVLLDGPLPGENELHGVYFEYRRGARIGTEYLMQKGHKKIALITRKIDRYSRQAVKEGFRDAFAYSVLAFDERDVFESEENDDFQVGVSLAYRILDSEIPYTAILANNDSVAAGAISGMTSRKINVPDQISIMGIDDNVYSRMTTPTLTTVRIPSKEMGALAAQCVLNAINGQEMISDIYMLASVVERNSVKDRSK